MEFFALGLTETERAMLAGNRVGKALRHGTKVMTPTGMVPIEDLAVGDFVMSGSGRPTVVVGVYPQGRVPLFDLSFDGYRTVTACAEHRWTAMRPAHRYAQRLSHGRWERNPRFGRWTVETTAALSQYGNAPKHRALVPLTQPFQLPDAPLPLDPYAMGVLLGDGSFKAKSVRFTSADGEIVEAMRGLCDVSSYAPAYEFGVRGAMPTMRELGLAGLRSYEKHIPAIYLRGSEAQRLALMQGLMDTDGSIMKTGAMEFSTSSDDLADDFMWLAASLGMKARRERRHTKSQDGVGRPSWRIRLRSATLCPFRLQRKASRWVPVKKTREWVLYGVTEAESGPATCIEVADPSHTFVLEGGIVTHNTESVGAFETTLHLTGLYPEWWVGRRFKRGVSVWAAGDTGQTVRDIIQEKLLGPPGEWGTGMIPAEFVDRITRKAGSVPDAVEAVRVRNSHGSYSWLAFKSYDQGRRSFQGTRKDLIWLDEEPPWPVYEECLLRTTDTEGGFDPGMLLCTFTPLSGVTQVTKHFLGGEDVDTD